MKVWDITQPKDAWEAGYAKVEYARVGLHAVGNKRIGVDQIYACMTCGKLNTFWQWECETCDAISSDEVDAAQQGDYYER